MKISTIKHVTKDGVDNIYKNKAMSVASIAIVTATIVIFGMFLAMFINIKTNINDLKKRPMIEVFCDENLSNDGIDEIEKLINENPDVMNCKKVTKQEALEMVKDLLGDEKDILDGIDEDFLPVSFKINLYDSEDTDKFIESMNDVSGIEKINFSKLELDFINKIVHIVNFVSSVLVFVFLAASVGIISNTIKITVGARKREISIMRYVGASDIFVRGPFVVEGILIGILGGLLAFVLVGHGYNILTNNIINGLSMIKVILLKDIINVSLLVFVLIGGCLGAIGGIFSVQKYLRSL